MTKRIFEINQEEIIQHASMTMNDDFTFSMSLLIASTTWIKKGIPYMFDRTQAIEVVSGTATYEINLRHYTFQKGDLAIVSANSILEMTDFTPDYCLRAVSLKSDADVAPYCMLVKATDTTMEIGDSYFALIDATLKRGFNDVIIDHLTAALREEILVLYKSQEAVLHTANNRAQDIFNRFLSLVSQYSSEQRNIAFYAEHLFLSPRYLSSVIRNVSGKSVMYWVELSVINKAKIALRYTNKSIAEIARDLHFDEQTTFTRFFKRMTGMTPSAARD